MRIGVRARSQRQGIGRKLLEYLLREYPAFLSLDVSTDNAKAIAFYHRVGLEISKTYITEEEKVEFATFTSPEGFVYRPPPPRQNVANNDDITRDENQQTQPPSKADEEVKEVTTCLLIENQFASALPASDSPLLKEQHQEQKGAMTKAAMSGAHNSDAETSSSSSEQSVENNTLKASPVLTSNL